MAAEKCQACNGKELVPADLRKFGFGPGFTAFISAGCPSRSYDDDGSISYEIVCPACDGSGEAPTPIPRQEGN